MKYVVLFSLLAVVLDVQGFFFEGKLCYGDLGCFTKENFLVLPDKPETINTVINLYTRKQPDVPQMVYSRSTPHRGAPFPPEESAAFIIHGFKSNGYVRWVRETVEALHQVSSIENVFVVDWKDGADHSVFTYPQAAANSAVVAAELAKYVSYLNVTNRYVHLIGHSLGAHIAGMAAKRHKNRGYFPVARITGLDPANQLFDYAESKFRLDVDDAMFVDVIHTNAGGLGITQEVGDVDFFVNGGTKQPMCSWIPFRDAENYIENIDDDDDDYYYYYYDEYDFDDYGDDDDDIATKDRKFNIFKVNPCSHSMSIQFFLESLKYLNCSHWGVQEKKNPCYDKSIDAPRDLSKSCAQNLCSALGLHTALLPARGKILMEIEKNKMCTATERQLVNSARSLHHRITHKKCSREDIMTVLQSKILPSSNGKLNTIYRK
ncbi:pancreatic triacylglycerol lipase [Anabrus simplex]|uniref:pancreatic triacylglycerol lipase n=1 Tax=Anabrus simplex TaxID=316456 RepID=UPI0035A329A2